MQSDKYKKTEWLNMSTSKLISSLWNKTMQTENHKFKKIKNSDPQTVKIFCVAWNVFMTQIS